MRIWLEKRLAATATSIGYCPFPLSSTDALAKLTIQEDARRTKAHRRGTVRIARRSISSSTIQPARPRRSSRVPVANASPKTGQAFPLPTVRFARSSLNHPKVWSWILKLSNYIVGLNADMTISDSRFLIARAIAVFVCQRGC